MTQEAQKPRSSAKIPTQVLRQRCEDASLLVSHIARLPIILAEMNQTGAILSPRFSPLLQEIFSFEHLCLSFPFDGDGESLRYWLFEEGEPPEELMMILEERFMYEDFCAHARRIQHVDQQCPEAKKWFGNEFWGSESQSVLLFPLYFQDQWIGTLHICHQQPSFFHENYLMIGQLITDNLAPILAYQELQAQNERELEEQNRLIEELKMPSGPTPLEEELQEKVDVQQQQISQLLQECDMLAKQRDDLNNDQQELSGARSQLQEENARLSQEAQKHAVLAQSAHQQLTTYSELTQKVLKMGEEQRQILLKTYEIFQKLHSQFQVQLDRNEKDILKQFEFIMDATSQLLPNSRNLLNHLESLQDPSFGAINGRQKRFLRSALRSNRYISDLLAQLTEYSRCMAGQVDLIPETLDLSLIAEEARIPFHTLIRQKNLQVSLNLADHQLEADERSLKQIFHTLFEHALDATPTNGSIDFISRESIHTPDHIELILQHDSEPISEEECARLFQPFQRPDFDPDIDDPPGIALALTKELVLLHCGEISAEIIDGGLLLMIKLPVSFTPPQERKTALPELPSLPALPPKWQQPFDSHVTFPNVTPTAEVETLKNTEDFGHLLSTPGLFAKTHTEEFGAAPSRREISPSRYDLPQLHNSRDSLPAFSVVKHEPLTPAPLAPPPLPKQDGSVDPRMLLEEEATAVSEDELDDLIIDDLHLEEPPTLPNTNIQEPPPLFASPPSEPKRYPPSEEELAFDSLLDEETGGTSEVFSFPPQPAPLKTHTVATPTPAGMQELVYLEEEDALPAERVPDTHPLKLHLVPAPSTQELKQLINRPHPPAGLMFSSSKGSDAKFRLIELFEESPTLPKLPMLELLSNDSQASHMRLCWQGYQSMPLPQTQWMSWLKRVRLIPSRKKKPDILSIGLQSEQPQLDLLLRFCCGMEYKVQAEENPAQGVHHLYRAPPHLLVLRLNEPLHHWAPLFIEMGRSARTKEVPILLFSDVSIDHKLHKALESLHYVLLQPF